MPSDQLYPSVDLRIVDDHLRSSSVLHAETENEADVGDIIRVHAVASSRDHIRSDEKASAECSDGLVPKWLGLTQIVSSAKVLRCQHRSPVSLINNVIAPE